MSTERIGILGGTFDPPHIGHLCVAVNARDVLALDRVLLVVANDPWQKRAARPITPAPDRLAMVRAAVSGLHGIEADDREIRRQGPSYTVDTLLEVRGERPGADLFVIVGEDAAATVPTWDRAAQLGSLATLVVVRRPGAPPAARPGGFDWLEVEVPAVDVSSTDIRARLASGRTIEVLVPAAAAAVIADRHLYSVAR